MAEYRLTEKPIIGWLKELGWTYINDKKINLKRTLKDDFDSIPIHEIYNERFIIKELYASLKRLNPEVIKTDDQCKIVVEKLKTVMKMSNLLDANEEFLKWLRGEKSIKFAAEEQSQTIKLIEFDPNKIDDNSFIVTNQFKIPKEREFTLKNRNNIPDITLFVNGIPLVVIEAKKTQFHPRSKMPKVDYVEAVKQLKRYQRQSQQLFVPNIFMVAVDSNIFKYAPTGVKNIEHYFEWKESFELSDKESKKDKVKVATYGLFKKERFLDIIQNFILYKTDDEKKIKIMARYNQYRAANKIVDRIVVEAQKRGLIWHTQGSGKSYTMLFTAQKIHNHPKLRKPTVFVLIDRIKLDSQISKDFEACNVDNYIRATNKKKLMDLILNRDRKIIISTIHKFGNIWQNWVKNTIENPELSKILINFFEPSKEIENLEIYAKSVKNLPELVINNILDKIDFIKREKAEFLNDNLIQKFGEFAQSIENFENLSFNAPEQNKIIILADEAHRTQEGDLASDLDFELHDAYKFGFTGTPIDKKDRNTYKNFGIPTNAQGWERYLDYYSIKQSIKDGFTVPIRYFPRLDEKTRLNITEDELEQEFLDLTKDLNDNEREELRKREGTRQAVMKHPERIKKVAKDIAEHFKTYVSPEGFKAQVVVVDKQACALLKKELDKHLNPEWSKVIFSVAHNEDDDDILKHILHNQDKEQQQLIIDNFKKKDKLPKILIVCDMLLTGFDAPIEQTMYLDKNLKDHTLLQAISRTNRPYPNKNFGLIIGYTNVVQNLQKALNFDEEEIEDVAFDFSSLIPEFITQFNKVNDIFNKVDKNNHLNSDGTLNERDYASGIAAYLEANDIAEEFFEDVLSLISQFESISPDAGLKLIRNQYRTLMYYYYVIYRIFHPYDRARIEQFRPKTRKLIEESIDIGEIDNNLPTYVIDDNNLKLLADESISISSRALIFRTGLRARLNLNMTKSKKFSHLGKKMDEIIEKIKDETLEGINILEEMKALEEEMIQIEEEVDEVGPIKLVIRNAFELSVEAEKIEKAGDKINELFQAIEDLLINDIGEGWSSRNALVQKFKEKSMILLVKDYEDLDLYNDVIINNLVDEIKKEYP